MVDDEHMLCNAIERILGAGHYVTTVTSAREALSRLDGGERFDLILCDLMMPEMTGMDLYDELQQSMADQAAKFIFMSGGAFTDNARAFLARSSNEVIDKPFRGAGLRQVVARFLQSKSSSRTDAFSIGPIASGIERSQNVPNGEIERDLCVPELLNCKE